MIQAAFKGTAKAFLRTYNFLSAIVPYSLPEWEKLSIFLTFLVPKLPAPRGRTCPRHSRSDRHGQLPREKERHHRHDSALEHALITFIKDHTEFYKQFKNSPEFHRFVSQSSFESTYHPPKPSSVSAR